MDEHKNIEPFRSSYAYTCVKAVLPQVRGSRPSSTLAYKLLCIGLRYAYSHTYDCACVSSEDRT